jgi:PAS domain S-box-containing protein
MKGGAAASSLLLGMKASGIVSGCSGPLVDWLGYTPPMIEGKWLGELIEEGSDFEETIGQQELGLLEARHWHFRHRSGHRQRMKVSFHANPFGGEGLLLLVLQLDGPREEKPLTQNEWSSVLPDFSQLLWLTDPEGWLKTANHAGLRALSASTSPASSTLWTGSVHPEEKRFLQDALSEARQRKASYEVEVRLWHQQKQAYRWYRVNGVPRLDAKGSVAGWQVLATAVDSLVKSRKVMRAREQHLDSILDSQNTYLIRIDDQARYSYVNQTFQQRFYADLFSPIGRACLVGVHPQDVGRFAAALQHCLAHPGAHRWVEVRKRDRHGTYVHTEWELASVKCHPSGCQEVQAMGRDITPQRQAEAQLRRLALALKHIDNGIAVADAQGHVDWVNQAYEAISGYSLAELQGQPLWPLIAGPQTDADVLARIERALQGQQSIQVELLGYHPEGHTYWQEVSLQPVWDQVGKVQQYLIIFRDITARQERTQTLERLTRDLIHRNRDLSEFAYIVSHNLRAQVANILGLSQILKEELTGSSQPEAVSRLFQSTDQLDGVIRDLQDLLEQQQAEPVPYSYLELETMTSIVLGSFQSIIQKTEAQITWDFSAAPVAYAIRPYLFNMLQNLISNALKFCAPDQVPQVHLYSELSTDEATLRLCIQDRGLGMTPSQAQRYLFQPYQRFHPQIEGKGIELYLVRNQVESMGGSIWVESERGQGSAFWVQLPHRPAAS